MGSGGGKKSPKKKKQRIYLEPFLAVEPMGTAKERGKSAEIRRA